MEVGVICLGEKEGGDHLGGMSEGEIVVRKYCERRESIFNLKRKKEGRKEGGRKGGGMEAGGEGERDGGRKEIIHIIYVIYNIP